MNHNKKNTSNPVSDIIKTVAKSEETEKPYVRIVEQPRSRGLRFRYQCEGRRSGVIEGENSSRSKKSYPKIEIVNNRGQSFVVVSCVTVNSPHRPHPHRIEGKGKEFSHGICYMKVPAGRNVIEFSRMTIQCVKKIQALSALEERRRLKVDPFMTGFSDGVESLDLSCVRLCFQVFLEDNKKGIFNVALKPVVTQPIYDKKSSVEFDIKWISHHVATVAGGKVICIISDKLVKGDIEVIFFCEKSCWEAKAEFTYPYFHKQVAVVLKTPPYFTQDVTESVQVQVMLHRPSNGETSIPVPFELLPVEVESRDSKRVKRLRECMTPRTIMEQHILTKDRKALLQLPININGVSKERKFSNEYNFKVLSSAPKTTMEFKHILDNYVYADQR